MYELKNVLEEQRPGNESGMVGLLHKIGIRKADRMVENEKSQASLTQRESKGFSQAGRFEIRTDLAVEKKEDFTEKARELSGVSMREWYQKESRVKLTKVEILNEEGSRAMGKAVGTYITLEAGQMAFKDEDYHRQVSAELAGQIRDLAGKTGKEVRHLLVVGLGNHLVTPDSLGPQVVGNLNVTRHLDMEYGSGFLKDRGMIAISGMIPGVMAQTGMETAEIIRGIVSQTKPDLMIAIDALAARSVRRLGTTIQLTDTWIHPGSGVGNHRRALTEETLGIPVLAVGVPTVVGAAAIVQDTVQAMIRVLKNDSSTRGAGDYLESLEAEEQYRLIQELLEPEFGPFYVTPPDIDETVKAVSYTISEAILQAFLP